MFWISPSLKKLTQVLVAERSFDDVYLKNKLTKTKNKKTKTKQKSKKQNKKQNKTNQQTKSYDIQCSQDLVKNTGQILMFPLNYIRNIFKAFFGQHFICF